MPLVVDETTKTEKKTKFEEALNLLESAFSYAKSMYQSEVLQEAKNLINEEEGIKKLYEYADRFEEVGVFQDGPWEHAAKLQPKLVKGSLMMEDATSTVEILSELRMLAIAEGKLEKSDVTKDQAKGYLNEVIALNLDILFPEQTEASRIDGKEKQKERAKKLFDFLVEKLSLKGISGVLIKEIDRLIAQRTIMVNRVVGFIRVAKELLNTDINPEEREQIEFYYNAISGPTPKSKENLKPSEYGKSIKGLEHEELKKEAEIFAKYMRDTGLVCPQHAVLVKYLNRYDTKNHELMVAVLGLNNKGKAELEQYYETVHNLINAAIHPPTRQAVYGLTLMLERGVLSSMPVIPGLHRLVELDIQPETRKVLLSSIEKSAGVTANDILVAGTISVLGQPLGVGQGLNPTCQTARGISLWSTHSPGFLLELIARAARDGDVDIVFEGTQIHSKHLGKGLVKDLHEELDPVSLALVPHLDRLYYELVKLSKFRGDDAHKWVNPAFYGNWVSKGFMSVIDAFTGVIADYAGFVKLFYATHHPEYNYEHKLIYPNPVGIFVTNSFGDLLGFHAVSIQRIAQDEKGEYRIYIYNPNNDSSQDWGQNITPEVIGNGEEPGESSLPFHQFVSRLYAFHYNPYEKGDVSLVDDEIVEKTESLAKESWGKKYTWT
ncbi:hypothetical protein RBH29_01900 [Herbivorax sp. ANBcel31]|uniref:hypothetical protein n=1 Tax=Herbivorax sp. ANBcel31 TaxID=3069754 RepID=UPI0027B2BB5F|nr:hypothetical protein [Herbivorax sp. ANBcel31]MDQ2085188.1 hypothetical protein [Herbivorax sp. ANBcel31]